MSKSDDYRRQLREIHDWEPYLLEHSGLPGPRGNLELANAVAEEGSRALFERFITYDVARAPTNDPHEFLAFCGVLGLGKLLAEGDRSVLPVLKEHASDPRWRIREAVAMALQRWGRADIEGLLQEMQSWTHGGTLEQLQERPLLELLSGRALLEMRAVAAGLCEPDLLGETMIVKRVLGLLHLITESMARTEDRKREEFKVLRKGLAYCWSVAVAASPEDGKPAMERWLGSDDRDIRWLMTQNLKKKRLSRMDEAWVREKLAQMQR